LDLKKNFSKIVNLNQWFGYGRSWLTLPLTVLAVSSQFSILLFYFGIDNPIMLITITISSILLSLVLGYFMFTKRGESIDKTMMTWRNTLVFMAEIMTWEAMLVHAQETNLPFPEELKPYGVKDWSDCRTLFKWILAKGEQSKAKNVVKKFFEEKKCAK